MHRVRHLLIVPLVLGIVFGLSSLQAGIHTAAAQTVTATVTCSADGTTCTVTLNSPVGVGGSITVTLSNGSSVAISCPNGCAPGGQYTVTMGASSFVTHGNQCVNGSAPGPYGCTVAYVPYTPVYNGGCGHSHGGSAAGGAVGTRPGRAPGLGRSSPGSDRWRRDGPTSGLK